MQILTMPRLTTRLAGGFTQRPIGTSIPQSGLRSKPQGLPRSGVCGLVGLTACACAAAITLKGAEQDLFKILLWPTEEGVHYFNCMMLRASVGSVETERIPSHGRSIAFHLKPNGCGSDRHCTPQAAPGMVDSGIHDVAEHHSQRETIGILTGNEAHKSFIDIFTHEPPHSCFIGDIQSLALAGEIHVLVVSDGEHEIDVAGHRDVPRDILNEERVLVDYSAWHLFGSDQRLNEVLSNVILMSHCVFLRL
ncbi:MAG: hypothetical protein EOQ28_09610 [Mesorhizobium sp.]|uniref:hypothetical protein n=1 Tax=Mesorhizobium sp. TaxID=1871066 RepID=UPI000FE75BF7|nr:hypothetical protein [Mesorhizobium sp.]RWA75342.1 MAG: hypothetical protein EOQ28_09610 [Mesorhizobium sp.]